MKKFEKVFGILFAILFYAWIFAIIFELPFYRFPLFQAGVFIILNASIFVLIDYLRAKNEFYIGILARIIIIGALDFLFTVRPFDIAYTKIQYRNHHDYHNLTDAYEKWLYRQGSYEDFENLLYQNNQTINNDE